jgi:hypothetical protein
MIPSPTTPHHAAELCLEVFDHASPGDDTMEALFCEALRAQLRSGDDIETLLQSEAGCRLFNRVGGFFGHALRGEELLRAEQMIEQVEARVTGDGGQALLVEALLVIADREEVPAGDVGRVVEILLALKRPGRVLASHGESRQ